MDPITRKLVETVRQITEITGNTPDPVDRGWDALEPRGAPSSKHRWNHETKKWYKPGTLNQNIRRKPENREPLKVPAPGPDYVKSKFQLDQERMAKSTAGPADAAEADGFTRGYR